MKRFSIAALATATLIGTAAFLAPQTDDDLFELRKNFEIFGALYEEIVLHYVDDVRPQPFMRSGINAMLGELDPYTHYYDEADMVDLQLLRQRSQGEVGLTVGIRGGRITVLAPERDTAPYRQGIRTGDVLLQVGESPTEGLSVEEVYGLMMGEPGTTVEVVIQRMSEDTPRTFTLRRTRPNTSNVSYSGYLGSDSTDGIGYVRLSQFGDRSAREVRRSLRNMDRANGLSAAVIDLRDNPGGILGEAVEIVGLFVPKGSVVASTRARADGSVQSFRTEEDPLFPDLPVVLLMNRYSASASEVVAGALQDYDRGVVLGETSFGKGLVQIVRPLPHNTMLKITISHYYLPSGRAIQSNLFDTESAHAAVPDVASYQTAGGRTVRSGVGIEPDLVMESQEVNVFEEALLQEGAIFLFADAHAASCAGSTAACQDDDAILDAFESYLERSGFTWKTESDRILDAFEAAYIGEVGGSVPDHLAGLRQEIADGRATALSDHRDRILPRLKAELRDRAVTGAERFELELETDSWVLRAGELLLQPDQLDALLSVQ